ncbi:Colicin V production protein [Rhodovastum atsumiense]|uniref:CvpA family protein n=1 Tax=Rhodovastum atsumiense TaxID=504468 RepID=A0A5M6IV92_9PROT|nr:CvpA family protein [Rhodovastum atsumiense]KAA5612233.1 CvpA family protein [Rhodovastum atsumiense]CAH2601554.1 Colicin V production protein [Rhodovastum atsumiense]
MNWVDIVVLAVIAVSAMLAFLRGFVREVLGIGAWVAAAAAALWGAPDFEPRVRAWMGNGDLSAPIAYVAVFVVSLILLSVVAGLIGGVVRGSALGGVDRSLGVVFGIVRGAALVVVAYIAAGFLVAPERWPEPVLQARTLPYAYEGATWLAEQLPPRYRPAVPKPPPGRETRAADLLHVPAQGRATARP